MDGATTNDVVYSRNDLAMCKNCNANDFNFNNEPDFF